MSHNLYNVALRLKPLLTLRRPRTDDLSPLSTRMAIRIPDKVAFRRRGGDEVVPVVVELEVAVPRSVPTGW